MSIPSSTNTAHADKVLLDQETQTVSLQKKEASTHIDSHDEELVTSGEQKASSHELSPSMIEMDRFRRVSLMKDIEHQELVYGITKEQFVYEFALATNFSEAEDPQLFKNIFGIGENAFEDWRNGRESQAPKDLNHWFLRISLSHFLDSPEEMTTYGLLPESCKENIQSCLNEDTSASRLCKLHRWQGEAKHLALFQSQTLSDENRQSLSVLEWTLKHELEGAEFLNHAYVFEQMDGLQNWLQMFLTDIHPIENEGDVQSYLARLHALERRLTQACHLTREQADQDICPPGYILDKVITALKIDPDPENHPFYKNLKEKIAIAEIEEKDYLEQAYHTVRHIVIPAYQQVIDTLEEIKSNSTTEAGMWKLPNGERYYAHCLKKHTTTDLSPSQVFEMGLEEVAKVQAEMRTQFTLLGYPEDQPLASCLKELSLNPSSFFPNTPEGIESGLALCRSYQVVIEEAISPYFSKRPKTSMEIRPVPVEMAETAPMAYYMPANLDGSRPGVFYLNTRDMKDVLLFELKNLFLHEAIPGHHFQISISQEMEDLPLFRKLDGFNAYVEGWGLYSEYLGWEGGFFSSPEEKIGHLMDNLMRAARLVVDTGLHAKQWTREEAIHYMQENTGMPEKDIISEVERYIVFPGQACSYKIGQKELIRYRELAKTRLGDAFDIKEFHRWLLDMGAVPLEVLDTEINIWIESQRT